MADIQYKVITTSTGGFDAAIKVEKYVDGVLESSTPMPYQTYQQTWLDFDGYFRIQYNGSDGYRWCMEIISGITEYADGEIVKWKYDVSVNYTLTVRFVSVVTKYLVRDGSTIYTVADGALAEVTGELNSNLFIDNGIDTIPDGALLMTLATPEVLCWTDADTVPKLTATVTATPQSQVIITDKIYLTDKSITGIESALATCEGDLIVDVSFDDKQTWKVWNGEQWATLSDDNTGMSKATLEAITFEQWNELYTGATGFYVRVSLLDATQSVDKIVFDFSN